MTAERTQAARNLPEPYFESEEKRLSPPRAVTPTERSERRGLHVAVHLTVGG